jgi:hypothetical protein
MSPGMTRIACRFAALVALTCAPFAVAAEGTPLTTDQALMLYFTDSGRSFGYQVMIARIQVETVQAEIARDAALLARNEELHRSKSVPLIDLEVARLRDAWNRKHLVVAEKNLEFLMAEYEAMIQPAGRSCGSALNLAARAVCTGPCAMGFRANAKPAKLWPELGRRGGVPCLPTCTVAVPI